MEKTTATIKPGTKFLDLWSGVHTIKEITDEHVIHDYMSDKGKKVTDAFMYRFVFDKFIDLGVLHILPLQDN